MQLIRFIIFILLLFAMDSHAQNIWMVPNKGQWDDRILYSVELVNGNMLIEKDGFTYSFSNVREMYGHAHDQKDNHEHFQQQEDLLKAHAIRSVFLGSDWKGSRIESDSSDFYANFLLGNDPSKWKSSVYSYSKVEFLEFYPGVDLFLDSKKSQLEYSFKVQQGSDPSVIRKEFIGAEKIWIDENGVLHIKHRFGEVLESAPIAWTEKNGKKVSVVCHFLLRDHVLSFDFPEGYDSTANLFIDPSLTFSTFTGSTADNWGFTAAPDATGNLFAGGIVFGTGYPMSTGAYDLTYNGGTGSNPIDIGITKFNTTGTNLIYSTYIGGSGNETPNSIVSASNGELFIYGVTSSTNFPMAGTPYDASFNGGPNETENNLNFNGSDIYIVRLNQTGTALIASTYIGGSGTDGLNVNTLHYNYGDQFRGEIILDESMNVYVASTTSSGNFPITGGMQGSISGIQDAVVFKMTPNLNALTWSTFFGGTGFETGNSIQLSSNGTVFFSGGTTSNSLPITIGNDLSFNGGLSDGYVVRLNGTNGAFLSGTFMGFNEYDQTYFVQLDPDDKVYVFGQSQSSWPITPGVYGNPNSGQFIQKYSTDLNTIEWTTMIGAGTGNVEISPTAFLVSNCYDIYLSGWGGVSNQNTSVSQAANSTTNGFPVTSDAFQAGTNGSNFYIAVLDQDASSLEYATFMGGLSSSSNHVDGGTSRFDKSGRIYHAVCAACSGDNYGFTSTPAAWSPQNPSPNCNLAAFKFELNEVEVIVSNLSPLICLPDPVIFNNNSTNGNTYNWSFGDGTTSNEENPVHNYAGPGIYPVTLVVSDSNGCFTPDSISFDVNIGDFEGGVVQPTGPVCTGESFQLEAYGGSSYLWSPAQFLDDPTSATPIAVIDATTVFSVVISDSCGIDTVQLTLQFVPFTPFISNDTSICIGNSAVITVSEGSSFQWTPAIGLSDPTIQNPVATPQVTTTYSVEATSPEGCVFGDEVTVSVFYDPPIPVIPESVNMCEGSSVQITVSGGVTYNWSPNQNINELSGPVVLVNPISDIYYYCDFCNACGLVTDSVLVDVIQPEIIAGNDTTVCPGQSAFLWAEGGVSYIWSTTGSIAGFATGNHVDVNPVVNTLYTVTGTDLFGCIETASVQVDLFPVPFVHVSPDVHAFYGELIILTAESSTSGVFSWSPAELVSCAFCSSVTTTPDHNTTFIVSYIDEKGCSDSASVSIFYDPVFYVPNAFTPDGDEFNNEFRIYGDNVSSFECLIFNRWGELIYTITSFDDYWDGTYNGAVCPDGTYSWKLRYYHDESAEAHEQTGHVNLLR